MVKPDFKDPPRVEDPELLKRLHLVWTECALCEAPARETRLSLHHLHKHPRDDVIANLVMLCGDGTSGCHGDIEHADMKKRRELAAYMRRRPDTMTYLARRLRGEEARDAWLERYETSKLAT